MIISCVGSTFALAACQTASVKDCAGFTANNLSPAGFVALVAVDRAGAERVSANDRNGKREGCW